MSEKQPFGRDCCMNCRHWRGERTRDLWTVLSGSCSRRGGGINFSHELCDYYDAAEGADADWDTAARRRRDAGLRGNFFLSGGRLRA